MLTLDFLETKQNSAQIPLLSDIKYKRFAGASNVSSSVLSVFLRSYSLSPNNNNTKQILLLSLSYRKGNADTERSHRAVKVRWGCTLGDLASPPCPPQTRDLPWGGAGDGDPCSEPTPALFSIAPPPAL